MLKLCEHLREDRILLDLQSPRKADAMSAAAELLRGHPDVTDFDGFLRAVHAREDEGTTGIGNGVAIPHARTDSVGGFVTALARAPRGVDFAAVDGKPVKLVILMGIPAPRIKAYLRLLAHLSLLLKQPEFVQRLMEAQTARDVIDVWAEHEA